MRKLIESTLLSLDGVIESPDRWAPFDEEAKQWALGNLATYDAFLMGRVTFELFRDMRSGIHGDPYLDAINAKRKLVVPSTLTEATWNAELLAGDPVTEIRRLKALPGKDLIKYGTGLLDRTLVENDLVDEFQFMLFPVTVGEGRRLFADLGARRPRLELVDSAP